MRTRLLSQEVNQSYICKLANNALSWFYLLFHHFVFAVFHSLHHFWPNLGNVRKLYDMHTHTHTYCPNACSSQNYFSIFSNNLNKYYNNKKSEIENKRVHDMHIYVTTKVATTIESREANQTRALIEWETCTSESVSQSTSELITIYYHRILVRIWNFRRNILSFFWIVYRTYIYRIGFFSTSSVTFTLHSTCALKKFFIANYIRKSFEKEKYY